MEQIDLKDNPLRQIGALYGHNYEVNGLCFSPDGSLLASTQQGSEDVWIWDMNTQAVLRKIPGHNMAFSPDGTLLAAKTDEITLWDCATWDCVAHLPTSPKQMAFSPDGQELMSITKFSGLSLTLCDFETANHSAKNASILRSWFASSGILDIRELLQNVRMSHSVSYQGNSRHTDHSQATHRAWRRPEAMMPSTSCEALPCFV